MSRISNWIACGALLLVLVPGWVALADAPAPKELKPDAEGYIHDWLVLDPIRLNDSALDHDANTEKPMFDRRYFKGHKKGTPRAGEKAKVGDAELTWRAAHSDDAILDLSKLAKDRGRQSEKALFSGVVYITVDEDKPNVKLSIGSDDSSTWWLNGRDVIRAYAGRPTVKDQDMSETLTLKKGVNVLRFGVINGEGESGAVARFVDKGRKGVTGLKLSLEPPASAGKDKDD